MSVTRRAPLVAAAVAASVLSVFTVAACTSTPDPSTTPSTTRTSSTDPVTPQTPPTSSTTTTNPDAAALRSAEASIPAFWVVLDSLSAEPKSDLAALAAVARDPAFQMWQQLIVRIRVKGEHLVGKSRVLRSKAVRDAPGRFTVTACVDVSGANLVDAQGVPVATTDKVPRVAYQYGVVRGTDGKFYVSTDKAAGKC